MKRRIGFLLVGISFVFVNIAYSGGAVSKVKARKNPHVKMHVQVPKPRIHVSQQAYVQGQPESQVNLDVPAPKSSKVKIPPPEYHAQVLSSGKPILKQTPSFVRQPDGENMVDLNDLMQSLHQSSQSWMLIESKEDKQVVVQEFINKFHEQNIAINKSCAYYANFIDEMFQRNSQMLDLPLERLLQVAAVMEYDFDNGQDKDLLAQRILGPQLYEKNKKRQLAGQATNYGEQQ